MNEKRNFFTLKLGLKDEAHLKKLLLFLNSNYPIKYDYGAVKNKICYVTINSSYFCKKLTEYGIFQGKSLREVPHYFSDVKLREAYFLGLLDGDGSIFSGGLSFVGTYSSCKYMKEIMGQYVQYNDNFEYIHLHDKNKSDKLYVYALHRDEVWPVLYNFYKNKKYTLDRKRERVFNYYSKFLKKSKGEK